MNRCGSVISRLDIERILQGFINGNAMQVPIFQKYY
jgi:hypothetical protein